MRIGRPITRRRLIGTASAADSMMTNKFAGSIKFTDVEWDQAQKNSQEFRAYVT